MGVDHPPDSTVTHKPLDASSDTAPKVEPIHTLGGELLVSPEAGRPAAPAGKMVLADAGSAAVSDAGKTPGTDVVKLHAIDMGKAAPPDDPQKAYDQQHGQYVKDLKTYWDGVSAAKKAHSFVMEFPPLYTGPDKPKTPGPPPVVKPNTVPTINQMLDDAKHLNQFAAGDKTKPDFDVRQVSEFDFKQRYAQEALQIGKQYNVSPDNMKNIVRSIYAFEDGGWGSHETLSNMPAALVKDDKPGQTTIQDARRNFHAEGTGGSSALGYNQLMMANSMENIDQQSKPIADRLEQLAKGDPARAGDLRDKAAMITSLSASLDKELMVMANANKAQKPEDRKAYLDSDGKPTDLLYNDFAKSTELTAAGLTRQDMARAVHGLNLDGDIGPILQAQELGNLFKYAKAFQYQSLLQGTEQTDKQSVAAYDALPAGQKAQAVHDILDLVKPPTNDPAQQQQFNATKQSLEKKFLALKPGVDGNLAKDKLSQQEADMLRVNVIAIKDFGEPSGKLSAQSQLLLNKITDSYYGGLTADKLMPAALELANLAGPKNAQGMVDTNNQDVPTVNFFSQAGYQGNPVTNRRTGHELLLQIERSMQGPNNSTQERSGQADFDRAFATAPQY
jgi:hypothetical protein